MLDLGRGHEREATERRRWQGGGRCYGAECVCASRPEVKLFGDGDVLPVDLLITGISNEIEPRTANSQILGSSPAPGFRI